MVLVLDHMKPNFNIGKIVRTANAFGLREIHLVGIPYFNSRPCRGTLRQTRTCGFETFADCYRQLESEGYECFALDPAGTERMDALKLPEKSAFIIGHEEFGLSFQKSDYPKIRTVRIAQFGSVQSLNASIAAGIVSFEYLRQHLNPAVEENFVPPTFEASDVFS